MQDGTKPLTRFLKQTLAATAMIVAALAAPASAQDNTQEQETVRETHGDWDVVCNPTKPEECIIRQIGKTADGKKAMIMRVRKLDGVKTKDGKPVPGAIQITTPLGTLLRGGVQLQIDASEPRTALFEVCVPAGCIVREAMSDDLLASLKGGKAAKVSFSVLQQGALNVDISLKGFTKAFGAL